MEFPHVRAIDPAGWRQEMYIFPHRTIPRYSTDGEEKWLAVYN